VGPTLAKREPPACRFLLPISSILSQQHLLLELYWAMDIDDIVIKIVWLISICARAQVEPNETAWGRHKGTGFGFTPHFSFQEK
jgi:hypothetical protein